MFPEPGCHDAAPCFCRRAREPVCFLEATVGACAGIRSWVQSATSQLDATKSGRPQHKNDHVTFFKTTGVSLQQSGKLKISRLNATKRQLEWKVIILKRNNKSATSDTGHKPHTTVHPFL